MDKFTYFYFQKKLVAVKIITGKLSETCVIVFSVFRVRAINRLEHGGVLSTPITIQKYLLNEENGLLLKKKKRNKI